MPREKILSPAAKFVQRSPRRLTSQLCPRHQWCRWTLRIWTTWASPGAASTSSPAEVVPGRETITRMESPGTLMWCPGERWSVSPAHARTVKRSVKRNIVQLWTVATRLKFRIHVAIDVLQIQRKSLKPRGLFSTGMKARDESRGGTDWEGYEIKEDAMTRAKANLWNKVTQWEYRDFVESTKPLQFSLEAYCNYNYNYTLLLLIIIIQMQATWLAILCLVCQIQLNILLPSPSHSSPPPLSSLSSNRKHWEHTGINLSTVWAFFLLVMFYLTLAF